MISQQLLSFGRDRGFVSLCPYVQYTAAKFDLCAVNIRFLTTVASLKIICQEKLRDVLVLFTKHIFYICDVTRKSSSYICKCFRHYCHFLERYVPKGLLKMEMITSWAAQLPYHVWHLTNVFGEPGIKEPFVWCVYVCVPSCILGPLYPLAEHICLDWAHALIDTRLPCLPHDNLGNKTTSGAHTVQQLPLEKQEQRVWVFTFPGHEKRREEERTQKKEDKHSSHNPNSRPHGVHTHTHTHTHG